MTPEDRAFLAAWKICSAWDGQITKPVLRKAIEAAVSEARSAALEEAAKLADGFHWQLPMYADAAVNEATDDAACAVQEQIAAAIRSLIPQKEG